MSVERGLIIYFRLLLYLGIVPISINKLVSIVSNKYDRKIHYTMFLINQIISSSLFVYGKIINWSNQPSISVSNGSIPNNLEELISGIVNISITLWMFFHRDENVKIIQEIIKLRNKRKYKNKVIGRNLKILFFSIYLFSFVNLVYCWIHYEFQMHFLIKSKTLLVIEYNIIYTNIMIIESFYTFLILEIMNNFEIENSNLEKICSNILDTNIFEISKTILAIIDSRKLILNICSTHLSVIYGFVILLSSFIMLIDISHIIFYVIWILENFEMLTNLNIFTIVLTSINWLAGKWIIFVLSFTCNNVRKQVSLLSILNTKLKLKYFIINIVI